MVCSAKGTSERIVGQVETGAREIVDDGRVVLHDFGVGGGSSGLSSGGATTGGTCELVLRGEMRAVLVRM